MSRLNNYLLNEDIQYNFMKTSTGVNDYWQVREVEGKHLEDKEIEKSINKFVKDGKAKEEEIETFVPVNIKGYDMYKKVRISKNNIKYLYKFN